VYVESGYNVVWVSMRIVLRGGSPSYTILVRSCLSLCCCCTVVCGLRMRTASETCRVIINQVKQKLHLVGYLLIQYFKDARYHEHKNIEFQGFMKDVEFHD